MSLSKTPFFFILLISLFAGMLFFIVPHTAAAATKTTLTAQQIKLREACIQNGMFVSDTGTCSSETVQSSLHAQGFSVCTDIPTNSGTLVCFSTQNIIQTSSPLVLTSKSTGSAKFISLTNFPLFTQGAGIGGMRAFLNSLYQYLIGIAVILAILEIVWGGLLWMGSGASVTSKEKGKNKINMALAGLLLVLSPYLVFQIINPRARLLTFGNPITLKQPKPISSTVSPTLGCPGGSAGCKQTTVKTLFGTLRKLTNIYTCKVSNCQFAEAKCLSNKPPKQLHTDPGVPPYTPSAVCLKKDGTVDKNGRTWTSLLPSTKYTCLHNESPAIKCTFYTSGSTK